MSIKKAQDIANVLAEELGFSVTSYDNVELAFLKSQLEEFLDLEVDTAELEDPADIEYDEDTEYDKDLVAAEASEDSF